MRAVIAVILLALLSGCASYNYPVQDGGDGVYYASSPANYTYVDTYGGFSYYSPYFYPYYFSVWNSPWYNPRYGYAGYWPSYYWCPPYRAPRNHHHGNNGDYAGMLPIGSSLVPGTAYPTYPAGNPGLLLSNDALSLWRESMHRGAKPDRPELSTAAYGSRSETLATSRPAASYSSRMSGRVTPRSSSSFSSGSSRSSSRSSPASPSRSPRVLKPASIHDQ